MATKEQERKALEQIKAIVDGLGEDSYIGMAFEGCFDMARDNIDNDWGCSMKQRAESAEVKANNYKLAFDEIRKGKEEIAASLEEANARYTAKMDEVDDWIRKYGDMQYKYTEYYQGAEARQKELQEQLDSAQMEIIKLKARLYDFMTA